MLMSGASGVDGDQPSDWKLLRQKVCGLLLLFESSILIPATSSSFSSVPILQKRRQKHQSSAGWKKEAYHIMVTEWGSWETWMLYT